MLMTQTELNNLLKQINEAFQDLKDQLRILQCQMDKLEDRFNAQEKRPKAGASRSKRVQQTEKDS